MKKKQNKTTAKKRKESHPEGVEPETFDLWGQRIIQDYLSRSPHVERN